MSKITIPGYEILELIGSGGMAEVWKARQVSLDRTVAIKLLSSSRVDSNADIERFRFEAQATARLKHQGIIQIYDAGVANGMYFIAMEYVAGYTVGDWCRRKGRLPEKDILLVGECVADALHYAWNEAGIIHCDIKPDNVIIDSDGTVKVADLGLARTIHAVGVEEGAIEVMGTPNYISPEQSAGRGDLDCRTDIYALGASLYYLATGKMFFQSRPAGEVMDLQISDHVPDPHDLNPELSLGLCWLIEKMCAKDPHDRSPDWDAVLADIARVKQGKFPAQLPRDDASTVLRSVERARHAPPGQAVRISHESAERLRATTNMSKSREPRTSLRAAVLLVILGVVAYYFFQARREGKGEDAEPPSGESPAPPIAPVPTVEDIARDAYNEAVAWREQHVGEVDEAIRRFEEVRPKCGGTRYAQLTEAAIELLQSARKAAAENAWLALEQKVRGRMGASQFVEALALCQDEKQPFARETQSQRQRLAEEVQRARAEDERVRREAIESAQATPRELPAALLARAADRLLAGDLAGSTKILAEAVANPAHEAQRNSLGKVYSLLQQARSEDTRILRSFEQQVGRQIAVELKDGTVTATILRVLADGVEILRAAPNDGVAVAPQAETLGLDRLGSAELMRRLGAEDLPAAHLRRGLLALQAGVPTLARRYFSQIGTELEPLLLERLKETAP